MSRNIKTKGTIKKVLSVIILGKEKFFWKKKDPNSISLAIRNILGNAFPRYKNSLFPDLKNFAWLDSDHVDEKFIRSRLGEDKSDKDVEICRKFSEQGYVIIEGLFSPELLDGIWTELEGAVERDKVWNTEGEFLESDEFSLYAKGRILNIHKLVPAFNECFRHEKIDSYS